jgi:hypothetical protein
MEKSCENADKILTYISHVFKGISHVIVGILCTPSTFKSESWMHYWFACFSAWELLTFSMLYLICKVRSHGFLFLLCCFTSLFLFGSLRNIALPCTGWFYIVSVYEIVVWCKWSFSNSLGLGITFWQGWLCWWRSTKMCLPFCKISFSLTFKPRAFQWVSECFDLESMFKTMIPLQSLPNTWTMLHVMFSFWYNYVFFG